jgi:rhodanese-related sulfurtransferase
MAVESISVSELQDRVGTARAPLLVDVRRAPAFQADARMIAGALRRAPETLDAATLPRDTPVVVYCVHGHEVSQNAARTLGARYLAGGFTAWLEAGGPTVSALAEIGFPGTAPTRWVTRERPKIDRIACPWLIRRFVDPTARFDYVPTERVRGHAAETGAIPYDVPDVTFTHDGPACSFDAFIKLFGLKDAALDRLAVIVRGADTSHHELAPQCAGLLAESLGLSANFPDDHEMLEHGMVMYDAYYAWCRSLTGATHDWNPAAYRAAAAASA